MLIRTDRARVRWAGWVRAASTLLLGAYLVGCGDRGATPPLPGVGGGWVRRWWVWHRPFTEADAARAGDRPSIQVASIQRRDGRLALEERQRWRAKPEHTWDAVVRIHSSSLSALWDGSADELIRSAATDNVPSRPAGVQIDADVPTARLADYAAALKRIRSQLPSGLELSITGLPDWVSSPHYSNLCRSVDLMVMQYYGNRFPEPGQPPPRLWETESVVRQLPRVAPPDCRVLIGLPAYGRCVVLDDVGRVLGLRHNLDPQALLDSGDWTVRSSAPRGVRGYRSGNGGGPTEESLVLTHGAARAGPGGLPPGCVLWFQWPTAGMLREVEAGLQRSNTPGILGVCYFRRPMPGEAIRPFGDRWPNETSASPRWRARASRDGTVTVTYLGMETPPVEFGVTATIAASGDRVDSLGPDAEWYQGAARTSPLRANRLVVRRRVLFPGQEWELCRLLDPSPLMLGLEVGVRPGSPERTSDRVDVRRDE